VVEYHVFADYRHILRLRLRDQHAVEGVLMLAREQSGPLAMFDLDRQLLKPEPFHTAGKLRREDFRSRKFSEANLGCYLPGSSSPKPTPR